MPTAQHTFGSAPTFPGLRVSAPAAPAAAAQPAPVSESSVLGSISSAIERLVTRGPDQLSVTVRFEQGGSVSLKLSMKGGEIAARIQTDVPGLESTLKSAWTQLANEWEGRGIKLATPVFSSGSSMQQHDTGRQDARGQGRDGDEHFSERERAPSQREGWHLPQRRSAGSPSNPGSAAAATISVDRSGLHTWA